MESLSEKRAGAVGGAEVRERDSEPEGAHEMHRRGRRERHRAAEQGDPPRTRVVGTFPDGKSALMLVTARLKYIVENEWGRRRY